MQATIINAGRGLVNPNRVYIQCKNGAVWYRDHYTEKQVESCLDTLNNSSTSVPLRTFTKVPTSSR